MKIKVKNTSKKTLCHTDPHSLNFLYYFRALRMQIHVLTLSTESVTAFTYVVMNCMVYLLLKWVLIRVIIL